MNEEILIPYHFDTGRHALPVEALAPKKRFVETARALFAETRQGSASASGGEQYSMGGLSALTFGLGLWLGLALFGPSDARRRRGNNVKQR